MRYTTFGRRTGLRVSELALGTASFGTAADQDTSGRILDAFLDAGGTTIDTSNLYGAGRSETVLGELLGPRRDDVVVITKYGGSRDAPVHPGSTGNGRKIMVRSLEASLRRLQTDHVDVLMPHFPDGVTPTDEIMAGLDELIRAGKVRYAGLSNFPAWRTAGAASRADARGTAPVVGVQTEYSLAERSAERELLPMAAAHGLGVLLYSPLAGGLLTGKYRQGATGRLSGRGDGGEGTARRTATVDAVLAVAAETDHSPVQVALGWLRTRAAQSPTALVPIVGPRTSAHLDDYLGALDLRLDAAHLRRLDDASAIALGAPHDDVANALAHGVDGDRTRLDPPAVPVV